MASVEQDQKAGDGSTLVQAGGNVSITLGISYADVRQLIAEEREKIPKQIWERTQAILQRLGLITDTQGGADFTPLYFTPFGFEFVTACRSPLSKGKRA